MIEIVKEKKTSKTTKLKKPYYLLEYDYMIGDGNGQTSESVKISIDNPFVERYVKLINKLKPTSKSWGVVLDSENLYDRLTEKQITEDEYNFLSRMMFEDYEEDDTNVFKVSEKDEKYSQEFSEGVRSDTEYSFLVFEGATLYYFDEYGKKHNTKIKK